MKGRKMPMIDVSESTVESITEIKRLVAVLDDNCWPMAILSISQLRLLPKGDAAHDAAFAGWYQIMTATDAPEAPESLIRYLCVMDNVMLRGKREIKFPDAKYAILPILGVKSSSRWAFS